MVFFFNKPKLVKPKLIPSATGSNASGAGASSLTVSNLTIPAGYPHTMLMAWVYTAASLDIGPSNGTVVWDPGGVAESLTYLGGRDGGSGLNRAEMWYLFNPTPGNLNLTITITAGTDTIRCLAQCLYSVKQDASGLVFSSTTGGTTYLAQPVNGNQTGFYTPILQPPRAPTSEIPTLINSLASQAYLYMGTAQGAGSFIGNPTFPSGTNNAAGAVVTGV